jgi:hypothetical protein
VCFVLLHSPQDHLRTGARDLDHQISCQCKKHRQNVFTYVHVIVVASGKKETQLQDLAEIFANMRKAQLKLNHEKCIFGVSRGKVLGCLVLVKAIEANPGKINAIVQMKPPGPGMRCKGQ